ncbi:MAG: hypothetical protein ABF242_04875 [Flavobacteriales bacterium]
MTNDILDDFAVEQKKKTPIGLMILSVIALIFKGLLLIGTVFSLFKNLPLDTNVYVALGQLLGFILSASVISMGIIGVLKILKMKRVGFYLYLISSLILASLFIFTLAQFRDYPAELATQPGFIMMRNSLIGVIGFAILMILLFALYFKKLAK